MANKSKKERIFIVIGILSFILINYPFLQIFNRDALLFGLPMLVFYLFGIWILTIAFLYIYKHFLQRFMSWHHSYGKNH
jgi:hypothetical protein